MTVADDMLQALGSRPAGMSDAELAAMLCKRHPHFNQTCRMLASHGFINRDNTSAGIVNRNSGDAPLPSAREVRPAVRSTEQEWVWEGNVQSCIATHRAANGWSIVRVADTAQRERVADIIAGRDGQRLLAKVKGWPSSTYAHGERAGKPKPTQPTLQIAHWFAEALTSLIRRGAEPGWRLALGLPDMPRCHTLPGEAQDITVYLVTADGAVEIWEREN